MQFRRNQFWLLAILLIALLFTLPCKAQVTIGNQTKPHDFSLLELISGAKRNGGLRLPELTTQQRDGLELDKLTDFDLIEAAKGLTIYNVTDSCVEYWNNTKWVTLCTDISDPPKTVRVTPEDTTVEVINTVTLTATVDPSTVTVQYRWEVLRNGVWTVIPGETASTIDVEVDEVGSTTYKAIAYNNAGSATSNDAVVTGIMPEGTNPNVQMYVGAFWKNNETGERLIQFGVGSAQNNNYGDWTAAVVWYDNQWDTANRDSVVLVNNGTVNFSTTDANAEGHQVTNGSRRISGTVAAGGNISFRIGLNKQYANYDANLHPARYAVVLLTYNNGDKNQKLFIRQGQGDDYVMRPGDSGTGVPAGRPAAVKFRPYNLADLSKATPINWNQAARLISANRGFTDFPTKAGYFFIYNDTEAFAPDIPSGVIGAWNPNRGLKGDGYWTPSDDDACPDGYRHPTDNATPTSAFGTGAVDGSEIRQSLWLNPPTGTNSNTDNSIWGYYADGYFDRKQPVSSLGENSTTLSAVNTNSTEVAYEGRLFYNPTTNASLFFSAGGYREYMEGKLWNAGGRAGYWTSTAQSVTNQEGNAWFLYLYTNTDNNLAGIHYDVEGGATNDSKTSGNLVRCVKE